MMSFGKILSFIVLNIVIVLQSLSFPSEFDSHRLSHVVISKKYSSDLALNSAIAELLKSLKRVYNLHPLVLEDEELKTLPPNSILIGGTENRWINRLLKNRLIDTSSLSDEGYIIKNIKYRNIPLLVICGKDILGDVYGIFYLSERMNIDRNFLLKKIDIIREPKMKFRLISSPYLQKDENKTPEKICSEAVRLGFNAVATESWPKLVLYDKYDRSIHNTLEFQKEREWILENRKKANDFNKVAKKFHLKIVSSGDVFLFPKQVYTIFKDEVTCEDNPKNLCIGKKKVWEILKASLREVLTDFPEIDYIIVRTGENYEVGYLTGNIPTSGRCRFCKDLKDFERLQRVINEIYKIVVLEMHKKFIKRTWACGQRVFHSDLDLYKKILSGVPYKKDLLVSIKHTHTDFWRYNIVNPSIGCKDPEFEQMVEFQCAREYEGKGAFPNYIGEIFADGAPEVLPKGGMKYFHQNRVRSVWVWAKGGGWGGPYLASRVWLEPNVYAASRLSWNPYDDPYQIAKDWATLRFGKDAKDKIAEILMKSDDAILHFRYIGPYCRKNEGWQGDNMNWTRDDVIRGQNDLLTVYMACRGKNAFEEVITEKEKAVETVDEMLKDFNEVYEKIPDREVAEMARNMLLYEKALAEVFRDYISGIFYYFKWATKGMKNKIDKSSGLKYLLRWREEWKYYNTEIPKLKGVATLYKDDGMLKMCEDAIESMQKNSD